MKEKDFYPIFKEINNVVGVFELKLCKADKKGKLPPFAFKELEDHQRAALIGCDIGDGLYHKISDSFIGTKEGERRFPSAKPFDCFFLKNVPAYVVLIFYIPRKLKQFVYIRISNFLDEEFKSDRKSLTHERALDISTICLYG